MAIYPCRIGGHRYPQPQQMAYCTVLWGDLAATYRARLCPKHFRAVDLVGLEAMTAVTEDSVSAGVCDSCGEEKTSTLFLRCFPSKDEERPYAFDACKDHADTLLGQLQIGLWEALPGR